MNLNYVGSVAERFMKFRSSLATEENISENLFDAMSIYVPKSLAGNNLEEGTYDSDEITADKYAVITVTVDNYNDVLKADGALKAQWLPVFNDGANGDVTLYIIVFDDTDFAPVAGVASLSWSPLTKAFNELYFISFWKTMFSEHYDGKTVTGSDDDYDDSNFFDMAMCLSTLCEAESTLSACLIEAKLDVTADTDENVCKVMTKTRGEETTHCTTLSGTNKAGRAEYFWGYLLLIGMKHTMFLIHNGTFMLPIVIGKWFEEKNDSGLFIGNKLAKIRLSGSKVKPTGNPSPLDSDVNLNLPSAIYKNLDDKLVGYFISISGSSRNNAELVRERTGDNYPMTAYMISRWIDYQTAQDIANFRDASTTLTKPVLCNEATYQKIQSFLVANLQKFGAIGRVVNIVLDFPAFGEVKVGNSIKGTAVWKATYIDDLDSVEISGTLSF